MSGEYSWDFIKSPESIVDKAQLKRGRHISDRELSLRFYEITLGQTSDEIKRRELLNKIKKLGQQQSKEQADRFELAIKNSGALKGEVLTPSKKRPQIIYKKPAEWVLRSRESRLKMEEYNKGRNILIRFAGKVGRYTAKPLAMTFPYPIIPGWYGSDDAAAILIGCLKEDFLTGRKLDGIDAVLHVLAGVVPVFPASVTLYPMLVLRREIEDFVYNLSQKNKTESIKGAHKIYGVGKTLYRIFRRI
jgi:hypothetical protein